MFKRRVLTSTLCFFSCAMALLVLVSGTEGHNEGMNENEITGDHQMAGQLFAEASESYGAAMQVYLLNSQWEMLVNVTNKRVESLWRLERYDEADSLARVNYHRCLYFLGDNHSETGKSLMHLGIVAILSNLTAMAWEYLYKASLVFEDNYQNAHSVKAKCYEWLGYYHENMGDTINAKHYLWKSLNMWKAVPKKDASEFGDVYRYIGLYFRRCGQADSALHYYFKAKKCFDDYYGLPNFQSVKCYNNICAIYEDRKMFTEAMTMYDSCFSLLELMPGYYRYSLMMTWFNLGECYSKQGKLLSALECLQNVLSLYHPEFVYDAVLTNPKNCKGANYIMGHALGSKAQMLTTYYELDTISRIAWLKSAAECYHLAVDIAEQDRKRIINFENLQRLEHNSNSSYFGAGKHSLRLYEITGDTTYLSKALTYFEKNRTGLNLLGNNFMSAMISGKSDRTVRKIIELQRMTTQLTGLLTRSTPPLKDSLQRVLVQCKIDLDMLYYRAFRNNPTIFNNLIDSGEVFLGTVQKKLKTDQALILCFELVHYKSLLLEELIVLAIYKDKISIQRVEGQIAENAIRKFSADLQNIHDNQSYLTSGKILYSLIFAPFTEHNQNKKIVVVPSFFTGVLPFDAIPIPNQKNPLEYHPVIKESVVWKMPTIRSFINRSLDKVNIDEVVAVAPSYSTKMTRIRAGLKNRNAELVELPLAKKECETIARLFPAKVLKGSAATAHAFQCNIYNATIIHLSTHGVPDSNDQSIVRLAFSGDSGADKESDFLDFYQIVNLPVSADLVVLSACKTGVGQINGGVGSLNLSSAFMAAGGKSTLISQWDANDFASYTVMAGFYQNLKNGMRKPDALRQAKLDYLKSADETLSHPFFWAGFEYFGAENSYVSKTTRSLHIFIITITLILGLVFCIKKK